MSIVTLNKGAQFEKPSDFFAQSVTGGHGLFADFFVSSDGGFTLTNAPVVDGAYGSSLYLDGLDELETLVTKAFAPTADQSFGGAARVKIVHGTPMVTKQNILFGTSSVATPTERIGFSLATNASSEVVVTCEHHDGTTDGSVVLAESELPGGSDFDYTGWHEYGVLVEVDANGRCVVKYFIDNVLVKKIITASVSGWAAAGLAWVQTNLTTSSTVDQAIDWISLGSDYRP